MIIIIIIIIIIIYQGMMIVVYEGAWFSAGWGAERQNACD